ncbi:leucyl aminopeptidase family protein [bacterium]|nr:leucyl aminopeptidase family protein [bacterium]
MKFHFLGKNEEKNAARKGAVRIALTEGKSAIFRDRDGVRTLEIGTGEDGLKKMTRRTFFLTMRKIIAEAKKTEIPSLHIHMPDFAFPRLGFTEKELGEIIAREFILSNYEFDFYKTVDADRHFFVKDIFITGGSRKTEEGIARGLMIATHINKSRDLVNTPGCDMAPAHFAENAIAESKGFPVKASVLDKQAMRKIGMGGVLAVGDGSQHEPKFVILEYFPLPRGQKGKTGKKIKPIVLVGKGVTYDTGGINIKTGSHLDDMHMDMAGGAAVLHAVILAAKLGIQRNIVGLIPAAENMPSGMSLKPHDIITSLSGKTIEILNTDAEGRVMLADALTYAGRYDPALVVDVATLTGSAMSALGQRASAIFTKDAKLEALARELGEKSGDHVWPLPLWDEYAEEIKGTYGDFANTGKTRYGEAINAAIFLYQFVKDYPWLHIDIAPRMVSIEGEYLAKGGTGVPISLLLQLIEKA